MKKLLKKKFLIIPFISLSLLLFVNIESASAGFWDSVLGLASGGVNALGVAVSLIVGTLALLFTTVVGLLITLFVKILVTVANFDNIIGVDAVVTGWTMVRDICNMFFIVVLLIIAFGTILRLESYSIKRLLPKLLIMAVLINFSKTIFGLIIQAGQVVMLRFTNAFANNHGWFINMFQVQDVLSFSQVVDTLKTDGAFTSWAIAAAVIAGSMAAVITLIVIIVMTMILIMRVVMLWVYTILSPLVFLGFAFPALQRYTSRIWEDFIKQVIVGPIIAFFIWLALSTADSSSNQLSKVGDVIRDDPNMLCAGLNKFFCNDSLQTYLITIALLVGGLVVAQQVGGAAGSAAGRGMNWVRSTGRLARKGAVSGADWLNRKQARKTGIDLNVKRQAGRIKASFDRARTRDLTAMDTKASERLAKGGWTGAIGGITATGWADQHLRGWFGKGGINSAIFGGQDKVTKWRTDAAKLNEKVKYTMKDEAAYKKKHAELKSKADLGDRKAEKELKLLEKYEENIGNDTSDAAEKAKKFSNLASKYTVQDFHGQLLRRNADAEEGRKITSTNEDELIAQWEYAVSQGNAALARAVALQIHKVGGGNGLLEKNGYNAAPGFNKEEAEKLKGGTPEEKARYERDKGFNDFIRDKYMGELKMGEQAALAFQSDLASACESIGHNYTIKSVNINAETGQLYQPGEEDREYVKYVEMSKKDPEKWYRNFNRLLLGGEHKDTGDFKWTKSGLMHFISNMGIIDIETGKKRLTKSIAQAVTQDESLKVLKQTLKEAGYDSKPVYTTTDKEGNKVEVMADEIISRLKDYGTTGSEETVRDIQEAAGRVIDKPKEASSP